MTNRTYTLTAAEASLAFAQVSDHCSAIKNWMASAVEAGDFEYASKLVVQLRDHQKLYAKLNVEAHKIIDGSK